VRSRAVCIIAFAASALPAAAVEPSTPGEELLEFLGHWNGDEDWLLSDEIIAASTPQPQRSGKSAREDRSDGPAPAQDRTEQDK
jgi:hypothetical protein